MKSTEMNGILVSSRELIQQHRIPLMKYCFIVALGCSLISLAAQQFQNNLIPFSATLILNLIFLFGLDVVMWKALNQTAYSYRDFGYFGKFFKRLLPLFILYLGILIAGVFAVQLLSRIQAVILVLPAVLTLSIIFLNCINHLTLFAMIDQGQKALPAFNNGVRLFFQSKKLILHIVLKTFLLVLLGSFAVTALNVFVYAPQIDAAMKAATQINEALIDPYFSTNLSYMIQSVGMQLVVSYIAIVSGMTYGVFFQKRSAMR